MNNNDNINGTIFVTVQQIVKESGLKYKKVIEDVHSKKLPAVRIGKNYYVYNADASNYIFEIACKARGINPDKFRQLQGTIASQLTDAMTNMKGAVEASDKSKD